jgi:hypothetical protein
LLTGVADDGLEVSARQGESSVQTFKRLQREETYAEARGCKAGASCKWSHESNIGENDPKGIWRWGVGRGV